MRIIGGSAAPFRRGVLSGIVHLAEADRTGYRLLFFLLFTAHTSAYFASFTHTSLHLKWPSESSPSLLPWQP